MIVNDPCVLAEGEILFTVPFMYKGIEKCSAIAALPMAYNFIPSMLQCVEYSFGIRAFDLFVIPAFSKRFMEESSTVIDTLNLSKEKHDIEIVALFQHVDFHKAGKSTRFTTQMEEDLHHKGGLISSLKKIRKLYRKIEVRLGYSRLVNDDNEIETVEVFEDGRERVRIVTPNIFKGIFKCELALIFCLDFRLRKETRLGIRDYFGVSALELIGIPGSSKKFVEGETLPWKAIDVAYKQRGCRKFVIVHHADCGAYGGFCAFKNEIEEEFFHRRQMDKCELMILEKHPDVEVVKIYVRMIRDSTKLQFVRFV